MYVYRHIREDKGVPFYIGIGTDSEYKRAFSKHGRNPHWKRIVNKTSYSVDIMFETYDFDILKQKEIEFIALYGRRDLGTGTLCNMTDGGDGTLGLTGWSKGKKLSESHKNKISESCKGRKITDTQKDKTSSTLKAHYEELRLLNDGMAMSQDIRDKISKAKKGKSIKKKEGRPVQQYTLEGVLIKTYPTIKQASIETGCSSTGIWKCCNGHFTKTHDFVFRYK